MDFTRLIKEIEIKIKRNAIFFSILLGITVVSAAYFGGYEPYQDWWQQYIGNKTGQGIITNLIVITTTIYAFSVPISITLIAKKFAPYDEGILREFLFGTWNVQYQVIGLPIIIGLLVILNFVEAFRGFNTLVLGISVLYAIWNTYIFFRYIIDITINGEKYIIKWSLKRAKKNLL
ncbi:hypothetical protein KFE94_12110 [bacterium SCSIO 12643]|nr:hypothetical protein KFE94_12110 [bacterium SCSIO 12643]